MSFAIGLINLNVFGTSSASTTKINDEGVLERGFARRPRRPG